MTNGKDAPRRREAPSLAWNLKQERLWKDRKSALLDGINRLLDKISSDELKAPLFELAQRRRVRGVEFRRMIPDGGLAVQDDGFRIIVRADNDSQECSTRWERGERPVALPVEKRFTIAHELAHTFFFDLSNDKPREVVNPRDQAGIHQLEVACNSAARMILLPTRLFNHPQVRALDFSLPSDLRKLQKRAAVSADVLVLRIRDRIKSFPGPGGVLCIRLSEEGDVEISRMAMIWAMQGMFPGGEKDRRLLSAVRKLFSKDHSGESLDVDLPYSSDPPHVNQTCEFRREKISSLSPGIGYFVTFRAKGPPLGSLTSLSSSGD